MFVATKYFCGDKSFVATKDVLCGDKSKLVATNDVFVATKVGGERLAERCGSEGLRDCVYGGGGGGGGGRVRVCACVDAAEEEG